MGFLSPIFQSGMVLAAEKPLHFFGEAHGTVTVSLCGKTASCKADGRFVLTLPPLPYGGPHIVEASCDTETVIFDDVYLGDVILASGQSNMQIGLKTTNTPKEDYVDSERIRLFTAPAVPDASVTEPTYTYRKGWMPAKAVEVGEFSAIGYLVGKYLSDETDHVVGVIQAAQGASVIESWMPPEIIDAPAYHLEPEDKFPDHFNGSAFNGNSFLYEWKIAPILPYSVTAAVWYQGESDASKKEAAVYDRELVALVGAWRKLFLDEELPFYIVQIHNFLVPDCPERDMEAWQDLRAAQLRAILQLKNATLIPSGSICETDLIHPVTKAPLAHRIVEAMLAKESDS